MFFKTEFWFFMKVQTRLTLYDFNILHYMYSIPFQNTLKIHICFEMRYVLDKPDISPIGHV